MPRVVVLSPRAQLIVLFGRASPRGVFVLLTLVGDKNLHAYIEGLNLLLSGAAFTKNRS